MAKRHSAAAAFWLNGAGRAPLLTPAEELHLGALVRAWQDHPDGPAAAPAKIKRAGVRARNRFVEANLRLVMNVVQHYGGAANMEDRLQQGTLGLIRGAEKFDPARGYKFSTYAYLWIRQTLIFANTLAKYPVSIPSNVVAYLDGWKCGVVSKTLKDSADVWRDPALSMDRAHDEHGDSATLANVVADPNQPGLDDFARLADMQAALTAMAATDKELTALLELSAEGYSMADLAVLDGSHLNSLRARMKKALPAMRQLPEVILALGTTPENRSPELV